LEVVAGVEPEMLVQIVAELMVVLVAVLADGSKFLAWY
jgi:hypothetical protein